MLCHTMRKSIIIIPARMGSTRLPRKMMSLIDGRPMIYHVWMRAIDACVCPVVVATDNEDIYNVISAYGGASVMTSDLHKSGTDRVFEALSVIDPYNEYEIIINLQGDMVMFDESYLSRMIDAFDNGADVVTIVDILSDKNATGNVVRVIYDDKTGICSDFTRACVNTDKSHIGIYAYTRDALSRFVALPRCEREISESLEQLRAIDNGFMIKGVCVGSESSFMCVDTDEDLENARQVMESDKRSCV